MMKFPFLTLAVSFCLLIWGGWWIPLLAQTNDAKESYVALNELLNRWGSQYTSPRTIIVEKVEWKKKEVHVYANAALEDIPFREDNVRLVYALLREQFPEAKAITLYTRQWPVEKLIPEYYRTGRAVKDKVYAVKRKDNPLTAPRQPLYRISGGLQNRHIALWQSHGLYYQQTIPRWEWQRARLFGTVEDLYTQSYVLPFLLPMLENAGANVLIPRERDVQAIEVIVDNDMPASSGSQYREVAGTQRWQAGDVPGFAHLQPIYVEGQNPFRTGTFRQIISQKKDEQVASAEWIPDIPEAGLYAVYVAYRSLPNSTEEASYTVYHAGGETSFIVNQRMGGGTWIYLGHFRFAGGQQGKVVLTNHTGRNGEVVTADAVKIGGGMGNIARSPLHPAFTVEPQTSGLPRFTEAARYWLQWAGMPDSIYSHTQFENDYTDDVYARGKWVNYLKDVLRIPVDLSLAFHSDAGITPNDSTIGTLGIYFTNGEGRYSNKVSRETARDLTDLVQTQLVNDVRELYHAAWSRRGMWNQSYIEARVPDVPTMLLEILSHQNFADMRYGLDPRFRFAVSRAIYKGMLRYLSYQHKYPYVVQPLAPDHLHACFTGSAEVTIGWDAVTDPLEPTAAPDAYILYTRIGEGGFDNGELIRGTSATKTIRPGALYGFKVVAVNGGGASFPSEILTVCRQPEEKGTVLIVNGFDRISAPLSFEAKADSLSGFLYGRDRGVPYLQDISFVGNQFAFSRLAPWVTNDDNGHGDCYNNYAGQVIAGNTFDYPLVHGKSLAAAGYSFVSCSRRAVEDGQVLLTDYGMVDLILGKQQTTTMGADSSACFQAFTPALKDQLKTYLAQQGKLLVSGAYVASDLQATPEDRVFASDVLHITHASSHASQEGRAQGCASPYPFFGQEYAFHVRPNAVCYPVETADGLLPAGSEAAVVLRYPENNMGAAVGYHKECHIFVMGFPFECLRTEQERDSLMTGVMQFFRWQP